MMQNNKKGPLIDAGRCRCCGATKKCRIINAEYIFTENKEVYSDMILECFGLVLSHLDSKESDRLICATCVIRLRDAISFRHQVLECESKMLQCSIVMEKQEMLFDPDVKVLTEFDDSYEDSSTDVLHDDLSIETLAPKDNDSDVSNERRMKRKIPFTLEHTKAKKELRLKIKKTREKLKRTGQDHPTYLPQKTREKFIDTDSLSHHNNITIIENSYACPFHTSYSSFSCVYCDRSFLDPEKLREHFIIHNPKKFKTFDSRKNTYLDIDRIDCRICDQKITDMDTFRRHVTESHGKVLHDVRDEYLKFRLKNEAVSCTECEKSFTFFHALKRHMAEHFGSFVCDICGSHFFDRTSLMLHNRNTHRDEEKYSCYECGKLFRSKHNMVAHLSTVHKKEAAFQCSKCDQVLFSQKERERHLLEVHGVSMAYSCTVCGKVYNAIKVLRAHNRAVHLKIFRHKCHICGRGFSLPSRLNEHVVSTHRNKTNFYCDLCGKSYPKLHYLRLHIQSHRQDVPAE